MGYYSNIDIDRQNDDYDRSAFLNDMTRHRVTKIVTDKDGSVLEVHQQLIPRVIVLVSMAMTFCLAIAVFVLVSILLLGV